MLNETFSVIFQHLNCILVSTLARWDDQRDDVNQQAWEQPRKKSSQIYENYTAMLLLLNWKVSVKMPACQRLSKITSWKSLWWIARKRFPISSSCCSWQPEEHESFNFFFSPLSHTFSEWNGWICQQLGILARDQRLFVTPAHWYFFPFPMADLRPMVWKLLKMSRLNFCPIKLTCLVTRFDHQLQVFNHWPQWTIWGLFNPMQM